MAIEGHCVEKFNELTTLRETVRFLREENKSLKERGRNWKRNQRKKYSARYKKKMDDLVSTLVLIEEYLERGYSGQALIEVKAKLEELDVPTLKRIMSKEEPNDHQRRQSRNDQT